MKQLLLRVDDELHARLAAHARSRGTSVNALANQILQFGIDPAAMSRLDRLKLRLIALGEIAGGRTEREAAPGAVSSISAELRAQAIESLRGAGPGFADDALSYERGGDRAT
jgi:hypothetical protein